MKKWKILHKKQKIDFENIVNILLNNRGLIAKKDINEFLNGKISDVTIKNSGIKISEVKKAIKRINEAIDKNEHIVIYGDYDVDGISGTAILWEKIYSIYKNVTPYIPHRVDEGYGLSIKGIENCKLKIENLGLIITVDNGIVANNAVDYANKNNIDVIITDHHVLGKKLPSANAIVHTTKLCGAGVAYLLSQEIIKSKFQIPNNSQIQNTNPPTGGQKPKTIEHLDLVALATVADLVPLTGFNRILLKEGLMALRNTDRIGLIELFKEAAIEQSKIGVYEIGHIIAPRLNASGRMENAMDALRLICTNDKLRAKILAQKLGTTNKDRQLLTQETTMHASLISENITVSQRIIFVHDQKYNQGIIGLVASRLVEKHYKPSIVVSVGEKYSKGSARSIKGFNIIEFLRSFNDFLTEAGGHPMAAGFTIETQKLLEFKNVVEKKAKKEVGEELLTKTLVIDAEIDLSDISLNLYKRIQELAPFGMGNPEPVFLTKNVVVNDVKTLGRDGKHLKILFEQNNLKIESVAFGFADNQDIKVGNSFNIVYTIDDNYWNGNSKLQLKIKDIRF